jgi:Rrf2 family protein
MKFSRTLSYALRASLELAEQDSNFPIPCSRLAAQGGMPARFLLQVLRSLVAHDILRSSRGVDGGYSLKRSPHEISLLEVVEAIDGPLVASLTPVDILPDHARAKLERLLTEVTERARGDLSAITLADLSPDRHPVASEGELVHRQHAGVDGEVGL